MVQSFQVERRGGKAIYLQIYEHIVDQIRSRIIGPGIQLPTEASLAKNLTVSRNTVSMAYQQLEREGLVESTPGRGTFVTYDASATSVPTTGKKERISRLLDLAVEETLALDLSLDDYAKLSKRHLAEQRKKLRTSQICVIECNEEQLLIFADDIRREIGIAITPILLDDFREKKHDVMTTLDKADIILTSVYHSSEVLTLCPNRRIDVVGLQPQLDSLIQIAHLPDTTRVGLVCRSKLFSGDIINTLKESKLSFPSFSVVETTDNSELQERLTGFDAVIVSPGRLQDVQSLKTNGMPVIEFVYSLSGASMNLIKTLIVENQRKSETSRRSTT
jgi:DNA-binding transcriptional regulator YhcF (GntR family)